MRVITLIVLSIVYTSCNNRTQAIEGTWEMVYAETIENDSIKIKNLANTRFIKIINQDHFAFFNQQSGINENFYGGAGTYSLKGKTYIETLEFTSVKAIKNHAFSFNIELKGDSLIQTGLEQIKEAGINRQITEKYIKIN